MLKKLKINNFKALVDFEIDLQPFTVLIGPNASGKTSILQAISFIRWFAKGNPSGFLADRNWKASEVRSKLTNVRTTDFDVRFCLDEALIIWQFKVHFSNELGTSCSSENMWITPPSFVKNDIDKRDMIPFLGRDTQKIWRLNSLSLRNNLAQRDHWGSVEQEVNEASEVHLLTNATIKDLQKSKEDIPYISLDGSILSLYNAKRPKEWLRFYPQGRVLLFIALIQSLELLSPEHLRKKSRQKHLDLDITGKYLATFLHELPNESINRINDNLRRLYSRSRGLDTVRKRAGWTEFFLKEPFLDQKRDKKVRKKIPAQHISDGLLRIIAILASLEGFEDGSTLLIDEIENGIYPELANDFLATIMEIAQRKNFQIIATTHSPAILNAVPDESVIFVWRGRDGFVKAEPLFEDPKMKERLEYMSPGAVWHNSTSKQIIKILERQHKKKLKEKNGSK